MDNTKREEFLDELCPRVRAIIAHIMECDCGCAALELLRTRPRTWMETADIAYHLRQSPEQVATTLELLLSLGVISGRDIFGMAFYRLTEDKEILEALDQYWTWREVWRSRWQQMQNALNL